VVLLGVDRLALTGRTRGKTEGVAVGDEGNGDVRPVVGDPGGGDHIVVGVGGNDEDRTGWAADLDRRRRICSRQRAGDYGCS
jgi:hypothetical protein